VETCYRHPGRETGVSCSACGRPICPDCMTPTPVGMRCPDCARQRTRVRTPRTLVTTRPVVTYALIAINLVVFLIEIGTSGGGYSAGSSFTSKLELFGPAVAAGDWWRIVTSGFLHANFLHIALNMYILWLLGTMLEPVLGPVRFALVYFASLLAGSFAVLLITPNDQTLGASGAVFGLMAAGIVVAYNRRAATIANQLWLWIGINLLFTFAYSSHISVGAHVGGLIAGGLAALLLLELPARIRGIPALVPSILVAALGAAAVVGSIAVA
jgi:membrane associated rhomboid family serine protease